MLRNHDLNLLPVFDALMQEQQLSRAAERLHMSQPAVSNALKRLRMGFGDELFVRTGRGLKPTQRAEELHAIVTPALGLIRQSFEDQAFEPQALSRTIDISMNPAVEYVIGAPMMHAVRQQAPNLHLRIHPDYAEDIPIRLKDGRLNYAVEYSTLPEDHFMSRVLIREKLYLVCAADHPQIDGQVTLEQYETLPHVSLVRRSNLVRAQNGRRTTPLEFLLGGSLPNRNIALQMSSFVSVPSVVATTDLIAVLPGQLVDPLVGEGRLQCLPLPFDCPELELRLFWHKSKNSDPSHAWLVDLLADAAVGL